MAALAALLLITGSCVSAPGKSHNDYDLRADLQALDALPRPKGIASASWDQLKTQLREMLLSPARKVSAAPDSEDSRSIAEFDIDTGVLTWDYASSGDYNQDGLVTINDLTPLGSNLGASVAPAAFARETNLSVIDGDGNGNINIADITPLGANFNAHISQYNVYSSLDPADRPEGPTDPSTLTPIATVPFASILGNKSTQRLHFSFTVAAPQPGAYYWVRPSDGESEGIASNITGGQATLSVELVACPISGQVPMDVDLEAVVSPPDPGGKYKYAWDLDGDGAYEFIDQSSALLTHTYTVNGSYAPRVRVTRTDSTAQGQDSEDITANSSGWFRTTISGAGADPPFGPVARNLEVVKGKPAFAAVASSNDPLDVEEPLYYHALDTYGEDWAEPIVLEDYPFGLRPDTSAPVLLLRPTGPLLILANTRYGYLIEALTPSGLTWPDRLEQSLEVPKVDALHMVGAGIVDGDPAHVVWVTGPYGLGKLRFLGSDPAQNGGYTWGIPSCDLAGSSETRVYGAGYLLDEPLSFPLYIQPFVENADSPPSRHLHVFRSADAGGDEWSEPYELLTDFRAAYAVLIDGVPTVVAGGAQGFGTPDALLYIRATDETGASWNEPQVIGSYSGQVALREINGKPVVAYAEDPDNPEGPGIYLITATDATGTAWSEPDMVGCSIGQDRYVSYIALAELTGGYPACMYTVESDDPEVLPVIHYAWRHSL